MQKSNQGTSSLPPDLAALFAEAKPLTAAQRRRLERAGAELDQDPVFRADYLRSLFLIEIRNAMEEQGVSQSDVARKWGKSRQYVSRVLKEDARINYTIETLCHLANAVGETFEIVLSGTAAAALREKSALGIASSTRVPVVSGRVPETAGGFKKQQSVVIDFEKYLSTKQESNLEDFEDHGCRLLA